jgi:hypothetical protein
MKTFSKHFLKIFILIVIFIYSCSKDNNNITEITRASLTGTWMVNETGKKATYEVTIMIDTTSGTGVLIWNFAGAGQNVKAIAYLTANTLALANNEQLSNGWIVNGSGVVSSPTLMNWTYSINDGADLTSFKAVFTKK